MKNKILFQNDLYAVLDISTDTHPNTQTLVDIGSLERLKNYKLYPKRADDRNVGVAFKKNGKTYSLARFLMGVTGKEVVDHRDGNPRINILSNLRVCSRAENARNSHNDRIKGVWKQRNGRWSATICRNYKKVHLGTFDTVEEAAKAYNHAAQLLFGEFANLNNS